MQLPGRLDQTTLGDLLGALHRERATGVLELIEWTGVTAGRTHRVHLVQGLVQQVETPMVVEPLGELLLRRGFLDGVALRRLVRRLADSPLQRAGELLLEEGLVTQTAVQAALRYQVRARLDQLFELRALRVRFRVARPMGSGQTLVPLSPHEFLHGRPRTRDLGRGEVGERSGFSARRRPPVPTRDRALRVLGLGPAADVAGVRAAFRRLARELHPDRHPRADAAYRAELMRRFAELSAAYHSLVA